MDTGRLPRLTRRELAAAVAGLAAGCAPAPDLVAGEEGRIARVTDGDALVLDTGLKVRLVEIEAPRAGFGDRPGDPFGEEARQLLTREAIGRTARLHYGGLSRDRYERALAHVIASDETGRDVWLNGLMIRQGAARVRTFPDNARRVRRLLAFEQEARKAKRGLWALDAYRILDCSDVASAPYFPIIEGALLELTEVSGEGIARITPTGFRLAAGASMGRPDIALKTGSRLRIRGRIETREDQVIRLTHWGQVEVA
jgi:endonuclease YncB( thermonuclease family)